MNSLWIALQLVKRTLGRKGGLVIHLLIPALVVTLTVSVIGGYKMMSAPIEVVNQDQGPLGGLLVEEWERHMGLAVNERSGLAKAEEQVIRLMSAAVVRIPEDFTERLLQGESELLVLKQLYKENTGLVIEDILETSVQQLIGLWQQVESDSSYSAPEAKLKALMDLFQYKRGFGTTVSVIDRNPVQEQVITTSNGILILFILLLVCGSVTILFEDRRSRTLDRVFASPVYPAQVMAGSVLGSLLLGMLQVLFVLLFVRTALGYSFGAGFGEQLLVIFSFLPAAIGMAVVMAGLAQDSHGMNGIYSALITPTCMLGGCFWPLEIMPEAMQKLAQFVPQKWAIEAVALLSKGASLVEVLPHMGILLLFGMVLLTFGTRLWRPVDREG